MRKLLTDHLGLLLSTVTATTIVAKIWSVSHGGMAAVTALVSSGGALTSLIGALASGLPILGGVPLFVAATLLAEAIREGDNYKGPAIAAGVALLTAIALAPLSWLIAGALWLAVMCLLSLTHIGIGKAWTSLVSSDPPWLLERSKFPRNEHPLLAIALLAIVSWLAVAASDRPWMPLEQFEMVEGSSVAGFVITETNSSLLILQSEDRAVRRLPVEAVESRVICTEDEGDGRSLLSRVFWGVAPTYPHCEE